MFHFKYSELDMNLYVFAIGGSGSRVLRSLTMLLASGVQTKSEIVPLIIDPDTSNGDLNRTVSILREYGEVRKELKFGGDYSSTFFSTAIKSLNEDGNYLLPLGGTKGKKFEEYLSIETMSLANQALTKMLFSNNNLSSTMDVGFKGNPNIGSVVLNQFSQSNDFTNFENRFVAGDKIFIISSIFGGTGASGFPLILKTLRTSENTALKNAKIGAVSLLPYFNLKTSEESSIQSDSFITKTKAALNYYEKNVTGNNTLDDIYYLGDDFTSLAYDNCDGGDNQSNNAHFVEMLGALSVIDFDSKYNEESIHEGTTLFHEYGLNTNTVPGKSISFSDLGGRTKKCIEKPLSMMAILNSYINNRTTEHRAQQKWAKDRKALLGKSFYDSKFFSDYKDFKDMFEEWTKEMEENRISFAPFYDDDSIKEDGLEKICGVTPQYSGMPLFKKKGYDLIDVTLGNILGSIPKGNAPETFMELFYRALSKICTDNLKIE